MTNKPQNYRTIIGRWDVQHSSFKQERLCLKGDTY